MDEAKWVGRYRLIAQLGRGATAEVFLAVARGPGGFNKLVVLKQIRAELAHDPEFRAGFLDEARLAARLNHPNVVQTMEVDEDDRRLFITMEYLEGQTLGRIVRRLGSPGGDPRARGGPGWPLALHLGMLVDVLAGLHHAHELTDYDGGSLGVVHRDASPQNVMLTYDGQVKLMDFGIAKAVDSVSVTRAGVMKGRIGYMAPEQIRGERLDRRADVFAAGVMIWEALTGRRLWKDVGDAAIVRRLLDGDIPPPHSIRADVPAAFGELCMKALSVRREDRHATAADLGQALEALLVDAGVRPAMRDAGALLASQHEEQRAKVRRIIETQLRGARALIQDESTAIDLPVVDLSTITGSLDATDEQPTNPVGPPSWAPSSLGDPESTSRPSLQSTASTGTWTSAARSRRVIVATMIVAASTAACVVVLAVSAGRGPEGGPAPVATEAAAAPPIAASAAPVAASAVPAPVELGAQAPGDVGLQVRAVPEDARILLDGRSVGRSPWSARLPRDGSRHELRVEAHGYTSRVREVVLDKDLELELVLERDPGAAAAGPATAGRRAGPRRQIDTTNPYAQ